MKQDKKRVTIQYSIPNHIIQYDNEEKINSSFAKGVIKVAYTGLNRNKTYISKEAFERAIWSIFNCPVVTHYLREEKDYGGHDVEIVTTDTETELVNLTEPIGVVPESAKYWWESIEDSGGTHEYLCVEAYLWTRQEGVYKLLSENSASESMEISIIDGEMDEHGVYQINDFEFEAFCVLGEDVEPCFEGACVEMYSQSGTHDKYSEMMKDYKAMLSEISKSTQKKGGDIMDKKQELIKNYAVDVSDLDIENISIEDLTSELESRKFALESDVCQKLIHAMDDKKTKITLDDDSFYEVRKYWFVDYDSESKEVYYADCENRQLVGFNYELKGDDVVVDESTAKRKKYAIVDYVEGDKEIESAVFNMVDEVKSQFYSTLKSNKEQYEASLASITAEKTELEEYKKAKEAEERKAQEDAVFAKFSNLAGVNEYETLKAEHEGMNISDIEEKCYAIMGKNGMSFSKKTDKPLAFGIDKNVGGVADKNSVIDDTNDYGGLFAKFGIKPKD